MTANRLNYTKDALRNKVIEFANLPGHQKPSFFLDGMLEEVKTFNSFDFECSFFLNIHHLCRENVDKFWCQAHKDDISRWLQKARILTTVFSETWIPMPLDQTKKMRLLSADYDQLVKETFKLPGNDFYNYYLNLFDEYSITNPDFGDQINLAINRLFDWYKSEVSNAPKAYNFDPKTKKETLIHPHTIEIPLLMNFGINRHINADFFNIQIEIIRGICLERKVDNLKNTLEGQLATTKTQEKEFQSALNNTVMVSNSSEKSVVKTVKPQVEKYFSFMLKNDPRKHKQIIGEEDLKKLVDWVTYFLDNGFKLPQKTTPIKSINTNKGNLIYSLLDLFDQLHPEKTRPENLFILMTKCFHACTKDKIENLKKSKKPQHYDDLVKNK